MREMQSLHNQKVWLTLTVTTMRYHTRDYVTLHGKRILWIWLRLQIDWLWVNQKGDFPGGSNVIF